MDMHLSRGVSEETTLNNELTMRKNIITSLILFIAALTLGGSIKMLNAIDTLMVDDMSMPAPVSLNIEDINFNVTENTYTNSQYCSKDGGFTFFFSTQFPDAFTLRMVVDSEEPFRLNHRYEIPFEDAGTSFACIEDYNFNKEDDHAVTGWIEFTDFQKEGGILTKDGEVRCAIEGRFGFTAASKSNPERTIEVTGGSFKIPEARYSDMRSLK